MTDGFLQSVLIRRGSGFFFAGIFGYISNDSLSVDYWLEVNVCPPA
jgi:hypothetical protein